MFVVLCGLTVQGINMLYDFLQCFVYVYLMFVLYLDIFLCLHYATCEIFRGNISKGLYNMKQT
jgi:hypothetical protein